MHAILLLTSIVAFSLAGYLLAALLVPERLS